MNTLEKQKNIRQKICYHPTVTAMSEETNIHGIDHPITCDYCGLILECEHEYEYNEPQCWICGKEE